MDMLSREDRLPPPKKDSTPLSTYAHSARMQVSFAFQTMILKMNSSDSIRCDPVDQVRDTSKQARTPGRKRAASHANRDPSHLAVRPAE